MILLALAVAGGWLVTGRGAFSTKSIFLPDVGRGSASFFTGRGLYGGYWSSTSEDYNKAKCLYFNWNQISRICPPPLLSRSVRFKNLPSSV